MWGKCSLQTWVQFFDELPLPVSSHYKPLGASLVATKEGGGDKRKGWREEKVEGFRRDRLSRIEKKWERNGEGPLSWCSRHRFNTHVAKMKEGSREGEIVFPIWTENSKKGSSVFERMLQTPSPQDVCRPETKKRRGLDWGVHDSVMRIKSCIVIIFHLCLHLLEKKTER